MDPVPINVTIASGTGRFEPPSITWPTIRPVRTVGYPLGVWFCARAEKLAAATSTAINRMEMTSGFVLRET